MVYYTHISQVHLGTYMHAADAAVAYDRAARRFREPGCALNFNPDLYEDDWFLRTHSALDEDAFVLQLREFAYALLNKSVFFFPFRVQCLHMPHTPNQTIPQNPPQKINPSQPP